MSKRTGIVLIIVIIGIAVGGYFLLRSRPGSTPATTTMSGVVLAGYNRAGRVEWRVQATRGTMDNNGNGDLDDVKLSLYADGTPRLVVAAPTLVFTGNRARLTGGVAATLSGGYHLTTAEVSWDKSTNLITGSKEVEISTADVRVSAPRFSYDPGAGRLTLAGGVTARITKPEEIIATGGTATYADGHVVLTDTVRITSGTDVYTCVRAEYAKAAVTLVGPVHGDITAGKLTAARIEVTGDGSTASGDVKLLLNPDFLRREKDGA